MNIKKKLRSLWYSFLDTLPIKGYLTHAMCEAYSEEQFSYDAANFVVFNQIPGDYLEFGSYTGESMTSFYRHVYFHWRSYCVHARKYQHPVEETFFQQKRFFAFDSFEGLPASKDPSLPTHFAKSGSYAMSEQEFLQTLKDQGINIQSVIPVKGWYDQSLTPELKTKKSLKQAAAIYIDCDLYESAVPVFRFSTDLIQDGTVIMIDDFFRYRGHPHQGVQRAFREWRERHPEIFLQELTRCRANRIAYVCSVGVHG